MKFKDIEYAVYINLPEREDRNTYMKLLLHDAPVSYRRIDGIRFTKEPESTGYRILDRLKDQKSYIGIYLAHLSALRWARKNLSKALMLLEDDVILKEGFWNQEIKIDKSQNDWEVILVSPRYRNRKSTDEEFEKDKSSYKMGGLVDLKEVRKKYICTGAHCVIFRDKNVIDKAFNKLKHSDEIYDVDLFYINTLKTYGMHTSKVSAGGFESDHN